MLQPQHVAYFEFFFHKNWFQLTIQTRFYYIILFRFVFANQTNNLRIHTTRHAMPCISGKCFVVVLLIYFLLNVLVELSWIEAIWPFDVYIVQAKRLRERFMFHCMYSNTFQWHSQFELINELFFGMPKILLFFGKKNRGILLLLLNSNSFSFVFQYPISVFES